MSDRPTIREAARARKPLGGPDAQALEGALQQVERELDEARQELDEARLESEHHRDEWNDSADAARKFAGQRDALAARLHIAQEALAKERESQRWLWETNDKAGDKAGCHTQLAVLAALDRLEASLAAQAVAVPTGPQNGARECTCTGSCKGKDGLAPGWFCALDKSSPLYPRPPTPASRDSTPDDEAETPEEAAERRAAFGRGPNERCPPAFDMMAALKAAMASRDSTRGTACAEWCGTVHPRGGSSGRSCLHVGGKSTDDVCYCTRSCREARKPLHPTTPSTRGTCERCCGSGRKPWGPNENCEDCGGTGDEQEAR